LTTFMVFALVALSLGCKKAPNPGGCPLNSEEAKGTKELVGCCKEGKACPEFGGDCDEDTDCQEGLQCGHNNAQLIWTDSKASDDTRLDVCCVPDNKSRGCPDKTGNWFYLQNLDFLAEIFLGVKRNPEEGNPNEPNVTDGKLILALFKKTRLSNNGRLHWKFLRDGRILNRRKHAYLAVDEGVVVVANITDDRAKWIFRDDTQRTRNAYEYLVNKATNQTLTVVGERGKKIEMMNHGEIQFERQTWLGLKLRTCDGYLYYNRSCPINRNEKVTILRRGQMPEYGRDFFKRNFSEYVNGFGVDKEGHDYWVGLRTLAEKTGEHCTWELKVEVWDEGQENKTSKCHYSKFFVGPAPTYKLRVDGFFSHAHNPKNRLMDGLVYSNNMGFTTWDNDQDRWGTPKQNNAESSVGDNCSRKTGGGGWWYNACADSQLTGERNPRSETDGEKNPESGNVYETERLFAGIHWRRWKDKRAGFHSWAFAHMVMQNQ